MSSALLVINCGSSSVKLALYADQQTSQAKITAIAQRLGSSDASLEIEGEIELDIEKPMSHREAVLAFIDTCKEHLTDVKGIGHRVVHGGELFKSSTLIDDAALAELEKLSPLAPLHNPMNIMGIKLCQELFPGIPNVAVFDTAFHQTMPESAFLYGVPYDWYQDHMIRRYGFHGTSYRYVTQETARRLGKSPADTHLVIAHLGNGCSACAVEHGQSVDTTMGLTPLEGLIMGTRSGDIDPGLISHMVKATGMSLDEVMNCLNKESGLVGLSKYSNDMRSLLEAESKGNTQATVAIDAFCFRIARQLSALSASLPSMDALVFTGGIGENAAIIRERILAAWKSINWQLDPELNAKRGNETGRISQEGSPLVMVVKTDEELMIAQDTDEAISA